MVVDNGIVKGINDMAEMSLLKSILEMKALFECSKSFANNVEGFRIDAIRKRHPNIETKSFLRYYFAKTRRSFILQTETQYNRLDPQRSTPQGFHPIPILPSQPPQASASPLDQN